MKEITISYSQLQSLDLAPPNSPVEYDFPKPRVFSEIINQFETEPSVELVYESAARVQWLMGALAESEGLDQTGSPTGRASGLAIDIASDELVLIEQTFTLAYYEAVNATNELVADFILDQILGQFGFDPNLSQPPDQN